MPRKQRHTKGLLLFTNDGRLADRINQPGAMPKTYKVGVDVVLTDAGAVPESLITPEERTALTTPAPLLGGSHLKQGSVGAQLSTRVLSSTKHKR